MAAPKPGEVFDGYRFKGGNPNDRGSWEPVGVNSRSQMVAPLDTSAPGAAYLPAGPVKSDKSADAYYREWRTKDPQAGNQAISQARSGVATDRRAEGLLARQKTGGAYALPVVGGVLGMFDPEIRELDSIQSTVARQNRQPGEGAISDFDAQQFLAMSYGKDKPTETNKALIRARRVANDSVIQRRQFGEWFQGRFGTMTGFEEAWDRYTQDNPIFDPNSPDRPVINGKRQQWRQYFGAGGDARETEASRDAKRAPDGRPVGWSKSLPKPQLEAAKRFSGSSAPGGARENPFVPQSPEQFRKLPKGSWVIDDDGSLFQKQ